jgi:hypothetical protein
VQIGPYEAVAIARSGDVVTAVLDVPADAAIGVLLDCHVEFTPDGSGGRVQAYKSNDIVRVVE